MADQQHTSDQNAGAKPELTLDRLQRQLSLLASMTQQNTAMIKTLVESPQAQSSSSKGLPELQKAGEMGEAITSIVNELVAEMQGQIDLLESRSVDRTYNSHARHPSSPIQFLLGPEMAEPSNAPTTLGELQAVGKDLKNLVGWMKFYGMLPPEARVGEEERGELLVQFGRFLGVNLEATEKVDGDA
ncbi:mitochondrial ribosomal protein [Saitoella coloradoensis]